MIDAQRLFITLVLIGTCLLAANGSYAQPAEHPNALDDGAWALLFQVDDVPSVDFFQGMLAMKYHVSNDQAIRLGVGGNASTRNDGARVQGGASVQAQYLVYPHPDQEVNVYLGTGPAVGLNYDRLDDPAASAYRRRVWDIGMASALGVEWFATEHISLVGEYGGKMGMRFQRETGVGSEENLQDYFFRSSATLGIAAYF